MSFLPVSLAHAVKEQQGNNRWLVEELWAEQAVGIIGGEPKCCKSFLALTLAVAVASGKACFNRFSVPSRGRVLLYPAEDALSIVRRRLEGICAAQELSLEKLPIYLITAPVLRLDSETDRKRLCNTVEKLHPKLLVLDPFVRLHSIDENASSEVAKLLSHLRALQRSFGVAVAIVHHAKKGARSQRAGQALRGSSEFHAWGDSNLYLRHDGQESLTLAIEHRSEHSHEPLPLQLKVSNSGASLQIKTLLMQSQKKPPSNPTQQILGILASAHEPVRLRTLRDSLSIRHTSVSQIVQALVERGVVQRTNNGLSLSR